MNSKLIVLSVLAVLVFMLAGCAAASENGVVQGIVELPVQLQAVIGGVVTYLVGLVLRGRLPDQYLMDIAAVISGAAVSVISILLRLIPLNLENIATSVLNLIVVLLGTVQIARLAFVAFKRGDVAQRIHLIPQR